MKRSITIEFDSDEVAMHFAEWLCGSGEHQYWNWMEYREQEEEGDITVTSFDYRVEDTSKEETDPDRYGEFMCDWTIRTKSGRLDK